MEKFFLINQQGKRVVGIVEPSVRQKGLVFIVHGLGGWKEQSHIEAAAVGFRDAGCTVVRFDATNSVGESEGDYADATVTQYYNDLNDVIMWAREQPWYEEPFFFAGHSLGGIAVGLFTECYASLVRGVVFLSTVVSGELSLQNSVYTPDVIAEWKGAGWREVEIKSGQQARLKWSHMEDRLHYDLLRGAKKITMPVLCVVGSRDGSTPVDHQKILLEAIPSLQKEMHVVQDAPHTFVEERHLDELRQIIQRWLARIF